MMVRRETVMGAQGRGRITGSGGGPGQVLAASLLVVFLLFPLFNRDRRVVKWCTRSPASRCLYSLARCLRVA